MVNTEIFQVFHNQTKQEENLASIPEQLQNYVRTQIVEPAQAYYGESLQQHLSGLTPNISEVHPLCCVLGPLMTAACMQPLHDAVLHVLASQQLSNEHAGHP